MKKKKRKFKHEIGDILGSWTDDTDPPSFITAIIVDRGVSSYNSEPYYMIEWSDRECKTSPTDELSVTNAKELLDLYIANPSYEYASEYIKKKYHGEYK